MNKVVGITNNFLSNTYELVTMLLRLGFLRIYEGFVCKEIRVGV